MAGIVRAAAARRAMAPRRLPRDGAPPSGEGAGTRNQDDDKKGGPGGVTEVRLGPLPGRDTYTPSGQRPTQVAQQPTAPTWPDGRPVYPQGPPQPPNPQGPTQPVYGGAPPVYGGTPQVPTTTVPLGPNPLAEPPKELTARQERPLTIGVGMGAIEGKNVNLHYNITDRTAIGGSAGRSEAGGFNSYTLDVRQYVAAEKNWGIYLQGGAHALQNTTGMGPKWGAAGSGQLGLEWRTSSGITFNVSGGGVYTPADHKIRPTVGFGIGLSF